MRTLRVIILLFLWCLLWAPQAGAAFPVRTEENNKFGVHLAVPSDDDLEATGKLVNSNGGDWGYVTVVIQENDRDRAKWQQVFDRMRALHLIPIVRLATVPQGDSWRRPEASEAAGWVDFLNSLNWVVKNRYVVLFNEPNHGLEWGGVTDPVHYGQVAYEFARRLKEANADYFVMLAGLDQASPQAPPRFMDQAVFWDNMIRGNGHTVEDWERVLDGLTSHSYPNPDFSASPYMNGRGSITGYRWELNYLSYLGFSKELPVFITETGWRRGPLTEEQVAENIRVAFEEVWFSDPQVVAVTPFILNYQNPPFLGFSWRKQGTDEYYQQYFKVQSVSKTRGNPVQVTAFRLLNILPEELVENSRFYLHLGLKNIGQSIWDALDGYELRLISPTEFLYKTTPLVTVHPEEVADVSLYFQTPAKTGKHQLQLGIFKGEELVSSLLDWQIKVIPHVNIELDYRLLLNLKNGGEDFQAEVYDSEERLVYKRPHLIGEKGRIILEKVSNVAVGETYRLVLLKPGYLPRQTYLTLKRTGNIAKFKGHLPLDWNKDGQFTLRDLIFFLQ